MYLSYLLLLYLNSLLCEQGIPLHTDLRDYNLNLNLISIQFNSMKNEDEQSYSGPLTPDHAVNSALILQVSADERDICWKLSASNFNMQRSKSKALQ